MEPILDETSLVPCSVHLPGQRIEALAKTLKALDSVGATPILRSVRDAMDRDLLDGQKGGLRRWCFDRATSKDEGRFVASRLDKQPPFIDGSNGLFANAEGLRIIEAKINNIIVIGLGLAALTDGLVVALVSQKRLRGEHFSVSLNILDDKELRTEHRNIRVFSQENEVHEAKEELSKRITETLKDGAAIVTRITDVFPRLLLGNLARNQIKILTGNERWFGQLIYHLRALNEGARLWKIGAQFKPEPEIDFSHESPETLKHGSYGPMRDFHVPDGFSPKRWSLHTKLTDGFRLYFRDERQNSTDLGQVLIGYFGQHLKTVKYK
ncbi:MAG: hypothetical protein LBU43_03970 [Candidatus Accumulibacter sp.]|nr:hypothetical protein [Accumulibacter sp.]